MQRILVVLLYLISIPLSYAGGNGNSQPGTNAWEQLAALQAQVEALQAALPPVSASVVVDCDGGETLADALATPAVQLDVTFSGTCVEDVSITRGKLTLTGDAGAIIQGAVEVKVDGGRVIMDGVSITNSPAEGLVVHSDSIVQARALSVYGSAGDGIGVFGGSFSCADCSSTANTLSGLVFFSGGHGVLAGTAAFNNNGGFGILIQDTSALETSGDPLAAGAALNTNTIEVNHNANIALVISGASSILIGGNSTLTVSNNSSLGMEVATGSSAILNGTTETHDNGVLGFSVIGGSAYVFGPVNASGNNIGVYIAEGGVLRGPGVVTTMNNNIGLLVRGSYWGAANLNSSGNTGLAGLVQSGAIVRANSAVVSGFVSCDGTELLQASFACGPN